MVTEQKTITVALDSTFRDDLARALISAHHREIAEEMEAESGPLEKSSCGGQTFDPPCGGCLTCIFAQATAYDYDEPQWSQWRARADQLMASLRGVAEWRQRTSDNPPVNLADAPQIAAALEGLMAIPTCCTPGCDEPTEPFTDRCPNCLKRGDR